MKPFDHLVFDLDDTLLDTFRLLVPRASRDACMSMIEAGLDTDLESALKEWASQRRDHPRHEIFSHLVARFGVRAGLYPEAIVKRGFHCFYHRRVEPDITLFPGAMETLSVLRNGYTLHLVTSGSKPTQEEKIRILGIGELFKKIFHVDPTRGEKKGHAFREIQQLTGAKPERHLSIGNRVDTDIGEARALGWKGCWVRYGEHALMLPSNETEQPEFTIENIAELKKTCLL